MKTLVGLLVPLAFLAASFAQDDPIKSLKSKDVATRLAALERLSKEKSPKNEKAVAQALKDEDWEVAEKAAFVLGSIGTSASVPELVALAIDGPIARVRSTAAASAALLGAESAAEMLSKKSGGKEGWRALDSLAVLTNAKEAKYELKSLEKVAETAKDDRARAAAARAAIGAVPAEKGELLVRFATSAHPEVACAALDAAIHRPAAARVAPLAEVLGKPVLADLVERRAERAFVLAVAAAVAAAGDGALAAAEKPVTALIAAKGEAVAARGVRIVGRLASGTKLDPAKLRAWLAPALARSEASVRAQAAAALGSIGGADATKDALALLAGDKDERVRRAALDALVKLAPATDAAARAALVERLATDASKDVRLSAAAALGVPKNDEARTALEKALVDKDWEVVVCAAVSLGKLGGGSVAALADLAKKAPDWKVRGAACEGLMRTASKDALPPLIETLADADPCVKKGTHVFLQAVAGEELPPDVAAWRAWWEKNGARFEFRDPRALPSTGGGIEGTKAPAAQIWRGTDVVVLDSRGDHIQSVLAKQKVAHRMTMAGKIGESGVHAGAVFVANCTGEIEAVDVDRLRWFVLVGGNLFGSCWALHETIERALPGVVRKAETASEVLERVPAADCSGGSPYVAGVFTEGVVPEYALEGAHLIEVLLPERCEVLLDSPTALAHWGAGDLAVLFRAGHGTVVDSVNHFEAQDFQTVEGLKTAADRQAWAMDHMGLSYEYWRKSRGESWWESSVKASAEVQDLSVFRLVTNVVRLSREGLGANAK